MNGRRRLPNWRWEALRTTLWFVPAVLIVVAAAVFFVTFKIDVAAYFHHIELPTWLRHGSAQSGRDVLIAIAAAIITVVGVVFSITILALTLASQQFGPRMMRNFVRDVGNQLTLGVFVATFVYSVLVLGSITIYPHDGFVPHLGITVVRGHAAGGRRGPGVLHQPHRGVDPAPRGHRGDRARSRDRDRRRVPLADAAPLRVVTRGDVSSGLATPANSSRRSKSAAAWSSRPRAGTSSSSGTRS